MRSYRARVDYTCSIEPDAHSVFYCACFFLRLRRRRMHSIRILWRPRRALWLPPVNPLQQHRQLRCAQRHGATQRLRPDELASAQPFVEQAQSILAVPQNLDSIAALASKNIQLARVRALLQPRLHQRAQTTPYIFRKFWRRFITMELFRACSYALQKRASLVL